jgi:O-Antigen ligase
VTALALVSPSTPAVARGAIAAVFLVTLIDPAGGLVAVAAIAPLGWYLADLFGIGPFRLTEAMLLSFISAWLLRPPVRDEGPRLPRYATTAGWLFAILVVSLTAGVFSQLFRYPDILRATVLGLAKSYFSNADPTGLTAAAGLLEGLAIAAATIELFRRRPSLARSLPAALAVSAAAGALTSVLLWFGVAPPDVLAHQKLLGDQGFSAHVTDLNAAGTHFAMILCLSLGLSMRERGRWQRWWMAASVACAVGLWMSTSRIAEGAGYSELGLRRQFVTSSFRIIATHPYFGIGAGQYYTESPLFLTPYLAWTYGSENAHNNFLQLTAETGIIGLALFATWFAGGFTRAISALLSSPRDWRLLGAAAGVAVFLAACLGGHPLLVPEVALAFFVQFALTACLGASTLLNTSSKEPEARRLGGATPAAFWPAVAVAALVLGVWPALTVVKPSTPVQQEGVDGFYDEQGADEAGVPFRWTRQYASVFVPGWAQRVELTLRAPADTPADHPVRVEITTAGIRLPPTFVGDAWQTVTVELHPTQPPLVFNRINLKSDLVSVLNGRPVGIRVGDVRFGLSTPRARDATSAGSAARAGRHAT